jgi:hypothetical protein
MDPVKSQRGTLRDLNRPQRLLLWLTASALLLAWAFPQVNISYYYWENPPRSLWGLVASAPLPGSVPNNQAPGSSASSQQASRNIGAWKTEPFYAVAGGRKPLSDLGRFSDVSLDEVLLRHYMKYRI